VSGWVLVREAEPAELDAAGDAVVRAYLGLPGRPHHEYLAHIRDAAGRAADCPILVAVDAETGAVLGSVTYVPDHESPYAEVEVAGEAGFRMLGVAPEAQRRGVGRALVEACITRARAEGKAGLAISTVASMTDAHRLYRELGFRRAPGRDFSPVPGVDLWALVLRL
jgi:GNAT superfamily N-acetyltransferase